MNNAFENIPAISNTRGKKKTSIQEKKKKPTTSASIILIMLSVHLVLPRRRMG